ncbi:Rieske (2Fe-2S) protein [Terrabacter terrigena]|uniref:Rieske (2Fe-2S) protein n=1 Tax=Terrabacter terrigena TaxID=574718 RepID=A0ABW3MWG4_9MICO
MTEPSPSRTAEQSSSFATEHDSPLEPIDGSTDAHTGAADHRVTGLTDRRGVLKVAGVVGAGALAACSSPPVPSATGGSSSSAASSGAGSSAAPSAPSGGGTPSSEVPVGGAKFFPDTKTVVTQPVAGTFKAFDTTCPHQGCAVSSVADNQIVCPCHQSHFDLTTGEPTPDSQAKRALTAKQVTVTGDTFTVA